MAQTGRDIEQERGILTNKFCAECGYNLRTRPVVGRCPECGAVYDSRPLNMHGILLPKEIHLPFVDSFWTLVLTAGGLLAMHAAVVGKQRWAYGLAIPLLVIALLFARMCARQTFAYFRHRSLLRRSLEDDADD